MRTFGERLSAKLKQLGFKQKDLAQYVGVTASTISWWATNRSMPTEENLIAICEALDCDADWLLGNTRQLNRNGSGALDPTAYEAIRNIEGKIESEENRMEYKKGTIWEVETDFGAKIRQAVIVSADFRAGDRYLNAIFLNPEERGRIVVPVMCDELMYADCAKVSLVTSDRLGDYICNATEDEMALIDQGMCEALSLNNEDVIYTELEAVRAEVNREKELLAKLEKEKQALASAVPNEAPEPISLTLNEEIIRLTAERDMYQRQFEGLLNRIIG